MRGHVNVRSSVSFDGQSNVNVAVVCADDPEKVTVVTSVHCGPDSALHAERDRSRTEWKHGTSRPTASPTGPQKLIDIPKSNLMVLDKTTTRDLLQAGEKGRQADRPADSPSACGGNRNENSMFSAPARRVGRLLAASSTNSMTPSDSSSLRFRWTSL